MPGGASDYLENGLALLIFNATGLANIADNAATSPLTNLQMALHTADPGDGGSQTTSEASTATGHYTTYTRVAVPRTSGGFTVSGTNPTQATNAAAIQFPASTSASDAEVLTHWSLGTASSGAGHLLYKGPIGVALGPGTGLTADNTIRIPGLSGLSVGDKFVAVALPDTALPGGVTEGTTFFVKTVSGDTITISATSGGATLTITSDGGGRFYKHTPLTVTQNVQPQFPIGSLTVFLD